ncbi:hypothetical protein GGF46_002237 [Coemansia sp. RSA 552]|nr:hypothetical protein GGF46_002237 [Coemansia sp. RSA 552]
MDDRKQIRVGILAKYLELYAQLARPDITQLSLTRIGSRWQHPPMSMLSLQQLALLRYMGDCAQGGQTIALTTDGGPCAVRERLVRGSVRALVDRELQQERNLRWTIKVMEYIPPVGMIWMLSKYIAAVAHIAASEDVTHPVLLVAGSMALLGLSIHVVLRYSVMGILTAPRVTRVPTSRSAAAAAPGSAQQDTVSRRDDNDRRALQILRRAFPASPSDREMYKLNQLLPGPGAARPSWKLRIALVWGRIARRLAVVSPSLLTLTGVNQRLALMWLYNLPRMFGDEHVRTDQTAQAAAQEIGEFLRFVRERFSTVPLALTPGDVSMLASFTVRESTPATVDELVNVAVGGLLGIDRNNPRPGEPSTAAILANWRAEDEVFLGASADEIHRHRAAAAALVLSALIRNLAAPAGDNRMLERILSRIAGADSTPLSAPLCQAMFASACNALKINHHRRLSANLLVDMVERRFKSGDTYVCHLLVRSKQTATGWRRRGSEPGLPLAPIVSAIAPYLERLLAREATDNNESVLGFVGRWRTMGILDVVSSIQCLTIAATFVTSSPRTPESKSQLASPAHVVELWAIQGCKWAAQEPGSDADEVAQALCKLVTRGLEVCARKNAVDAAVRIHTQWAALPESFARAQKAASPDLNGLALWALASQGSPGSVREALRVLDRMRDMDQTPSLQDFDRLCVAASRHSIDISGYIDHWSRILHQKKARSSRISSFAKSLM